jgi:hypothetical protein
METTVKQEQAATTKRTPRDFVEHVLGFGPPVENATLASLFKDSNALHYGSRAGNCRASINAISREQWDKIHFTEAGVVLHRVLEQPMTIAMAFIKKEMAKKGFAVDMQSVNPAAHQRMANAVALVSDFYETYRDQVAAGAKLFSSLSLRQHADTINYDGILRVGFFCPTGTTMFLEYEFPQLVKNIALLITEEQVAEVVAAVHAYMHSFGQYSHAFREIAGLELSRLIVHEVVQKRDINTAAAYVKYHNLVQTNRHHLHNRDDQLQAEKVVSWDDLQKPQRTILVHALDTARVQITGFMAFNVEEASM